MNFADFRKINEKPYRSRTLSNYVDTYETQDGLKCDHYRRCTASNSEPVFHGQQPEIRTMTSFFYVLEPDADEQLK